MTSKTLFIGIVAFSALILDGNDMRAQEAPLPAPEEAMTLHRFRELVLARNLGLEAQHLGWQASRRMLRSEWGTYEPTLVLGADRAVTERDNTIEQQLSQGTDFFEERNRSYNAAIEQLLPTGGRVRAGASLRDLRNNLREQREIEGPDREYEGFLGVSLTQPLLKDAGFGATMARIRLARAESEIAFQQWRRQTMVTLAQAEAAYWQLVLAQEQVRFRQASVEVAETILADNRARVGEGVMPEIGVEQAEAGLALRRTRLLEARQRRTDLSNQLLTFFSERTVGGAPVVAADTPDLVEIEDEFDDAMAAALGLHPDYLIRRHQAAQEDVRVAFARNQRWPQLDLTASYGLNGLGESTGAARRRVEDADRVSWSVGVQLRVPLGGGVSGRNELAASRLRAEQSLLALKSAEIDIGNALDTNLRKVRNQFEQAGQYAAVVRLHERLLASELARLEAGRSDSRQVLDVEESLTAAQDALADSMLRYAAARVEYELAAGTILRLRDLDPMTMLKDIEGEMDREGR